MTSGAANSRVRQKRLFFLVFFSAFIGGTVLFWRSQASTPRLLHRARAAIDERRFGDAKRDALSALAREPDLAEARLLAANASAQMSQIDEALSHYERIPDDGSPAAVMARCGAGEIYLQKQQNLSLAEEQFRRAVEQDGDNRIAHDRLAFILGLATRSQDMVPHQIMMLRLGDVTPLRLYALSMGDRLPTDEAIVQKFHESTPGEKNALLGVAQIAMARQQFANAERMLRQAIELDPELIEAHLRLGELCLQSDSDDAFLQWHAEVPAAAGERALLWVIRGMFLRRAGEHFAAARCFWEAVSRDPNHQQANYQLGQLLVSLGRPHDAQPFLERSAALEEYVNQVFAVAWEVSLGQRVADRYQRIAELAEVLGLIWEAYGWNRLAEQANTSPGLTAGQASRLPAPPAAGLLSRSAVEQDSISDVDLAALPLPQWDTVGREFAPAVASEQTAPVSFVDRAADSGIRFSYFNGNNSGSPPKRIQQTMGGGVAAVDFDSDGWVDVYLTQGCQWPFEEDNRDYLDRLFRALGNGRFDDITDAARLMENGFSQGATAGDFDSDGFPDLYVANTGRNRFFHNNGDGTFSELTTSTAVAGDRWTTSCLLADLNGDAHPDVFEVNYLSGGDVFDLICRSPDGEERVCPPSMFPAAQDQLYLNLGNGRFDTQTDSAGIRVPNGKGLGIVACDFEASGSIALFVANDQVANALYVNQSRERGAFPRFNDEGLLRGVALNRDGRAEACMGVAAGDANGDGRIDLFVTNFSEESNTLYLQEAGGLFRDATHDAGLGTPSVPILGFGTQFIDGELDGHLDLIVTNGHIDDRTGTGEQYRMRPQYFRNSGNGRFTEPGADVLGPFFAGSYLGRGMARLDWNRDGLDDVAITHLDSPFSLLTNTTARRGHCLCVRLRGVVSSRDAIGTVVTLRSGAHVLVRQLTAGDGFQASNERLLTFGLADSATVDQLEISWPSGLRQSFVGLAADCELMIVEGRVRPLLMKSVVPTLP